MNLETIISAETTMTEDAIINQALDVLNDLVDLMTSKDCCDLCFEDRQGSYERCEIEDTIDFLEKLISYRFTIS